MSYKTIIACLDNNANSKNIIELSLAMSLFFEAHITGMQISYTPDFIYDPYVQMLPLIIELKDTQAENQRSTEEIFISMAKIAGVNFSWLDYQTCDLQGIALIGRTSDLVICSQYKPNDNSIYEPNFIGRLVLQLGKPLLLLPNIKSLPKTFDRIMIAWDGSRSASRAIADALPFLKIAKCVKTLTIKKKDTSDALPLLEIGDYLARHDIKVEICEEESLLPDSADWLITRTTEFNADMLVMGAYGHSRFGELIFGGMTQRLINKLPLPVLMSH